MFKKLFGRKKEQPFVTVVSGLPRSGTSMMMKMLEAGGIDPIQDGIRTPDSDNPKGYYEYERVKQLDKGDTAWVADAQGKSVKVISALLRYLPADYEYRILFMRRDLDEILASQAKMLDNRQKESGVSDDELKSLYRKHLQQVYGWVNQQPNVTLLDVNYNDLLSNVMGQLPQIVQFLGSTLDTEAMANVVDPNLYRNRAT
ncbi:MAG: sulfotransferase [Anaerolineae bacterium]|nr:sulfotransferase [Anaerolineae bacterium]MCO5186724.1 sulfotransferase [Anaerolineae bacterium]MCO5193986.1 sulfotransferase [Anaerolineae bacterium]MCO5199682.1 sulfotransferase [Anaerolineae bacterium]MCO5204041.1 sulfotransferase [Anaerolineae bacterium]